MNSKFALSYRTDGQIIIGPNGRAPSIVFGRNGIAATTKTMWCVNETLLSCHNENAKMCNFTKCAAVRGRHMQKTVVRAVYAASCNIECNTSTTARHSGLDVWARTICVVCRRCESNAQYGMKFKKYKPIVWRAHSQRKMTESPMKHTGTALWFLCCLLLSLFVCLLCALIINSVHIIEIAWLASPLFQSKFRKICWHWSSDGVRKCTQSHFAKNLMIFKNDTQTFQLFECCVTIGTVS